jgi:F-type H+-transporting ATPase subunit delta
MKKVSNKEYAAALYEATKNLKGSDLSKTISEFAKILFRTGSVKQIDSIINEFVKYAKKQAGIEDIEITSAHPLTDKAIDEIKKYFGGKVETTEKIDKELIGGIKIKTDNMILDGSLRKQLQLLKQSIN